MAGRKMPSPSLLRQILCYDHETGVLTWRKRSKEFFTSSSQTDEHNAAAWNARWAGQEALGTDRGNGYKHGCIFGQRLYAHRVIWAMQTDEWPNEIDHIDHNRSNNRWSNLQASDRKSNSKNLSKACNNTSGVTGVHFDKRRSRWVAFITVQSRRINLGRYVSKEKAVEVRSAAAARFKFSALHGG